MKKTSGVWQYLQDCGVLEHGSAEEIQAARREYWKAYKRAWKKEQRSSYTISLNSEETKELLRAAAKHHRAPTAFIKEALFAYLHTSFIVPDLATVQEIAILLSRSYCLLQTMAENSDSGDTGTTGALSILTRLEAEIARCLTAPVRLEASPQSDSP